MSKQPTTLTPREREFFDKLHALCLEYDASIRGNDETYYPTFDFSVGNKNFHEIRVNYQAYWGLKNEVTSVEVSPFGMFILHEKSSEPAEAL